MEAMLKKLLGTCLDKQNLTDVSTFDTNQSSQLDVFYFLRLSKVYKR